MNISCGLLNMVLNMKNRMVVQNDFKCMGCLPLWSRGWLGAGAHCRCPASWEYHTAYYHTSPGKDQNSKFEVGFYWMCITLAPL